MPISSGKDLYDFSTAFWKICVNVPGWKNEHLFLLQNISADKLEMVAKFDKSYSNKKEEKLIILSDNSSWLSKKGTLFTTQHFYGQIDKPFQFHLAEVDSISVNKAFDTPEFGNVVVNDFLIGKMTSDAASVVALHEYFRKVTKKEMSVDARTIRSLINPAEATPFLMYLSKLDVPYPLLSALRDNAIRDEEIYQFYDPVIFTDFRLISSFHKKFIRYTDISHVSVMSFVEQPQKVHPHVPHSFGLAVKVIVGVAAFVINSDKKERTMYQANFFVNNKIEIAVKDPRKEYILRLTELAKHFKVKVELNLQK